MRRKGRFLASVLLVVLPTACATTATRPTGYEVGYRQAHTRAAPPASTATPSHPWFEVDPRSAQEVAPTVEVGDVVRLRSSRFGKIEGVVQELADGTIVVFAEGAPEATAVALTDVTELEVSAGRAPSRRAALLTGGAIGAAVGLIAGLLVFGGGNNDQPPTFITGGAAAGALLGLGFGAVLPAPVRDQWIKVDPASLGQ